MLPPLNDFASQFVKLFHEVPGQQSLRTVVMSDVAGFTELMRANEPETMGLLRADMEVLRLHITEQGGEIVKIAGDGLLALFSSAPKAVRACIDAQEELAESPLKHRIAIHAGEVTLSGGDAYGDAVNVCSRIEAVTVPGSVSASKIVIDLIRSQNLPEPFRNGMVQLKGIEIPIEVYSWGNSKVHGKHGERKVFWALAAAILIIASGLFASTRYGAGDSDSASFKRGAVAKFSPDAQNSPIAITAEEALDQAYDEVWQEKEDFDKVKEEAISTLNPQLVVDWLNLNPLGQRERGRREIEHWSLVVQAMNKAKQVVGSKATAESMLEALKGMKDPNLEIAVKAFAEEFHIKK